MNAQEKKAHALTVEETEHYLHTSSDGLSEQEFRKRQKMYGKNVLEEEQRSSFLIFIRQFKSPLIFILLAAAFISICLKEITDFFVITGIIFINAVIGFWQELKAEASLDSLRKKTETKNMVIRGGKMRLVPSSDLVPGDLLVFYQGEVVTADIRLTDSAGLMVDESMITGESVPVLKNHTSILEEKALPFEWSNTLLSGSTVVRGRGHGIVVRTGRHTYLASIEEKAKEPAPPTPLQTSLASFVKKYVGFIFCLLGAMAILGTVQGRPPLELFYLLLASLVSAVPEGLPIVITLVMMRGALLLQKKQVLVRDLPSVETLGSTTIIATDKTGTITEGRLLVQDTYTKDVAKIKQIGVLCNDSREGLGDPLDVALVDWVENAQDIRTLFPKKWELSFDSSLMFMASIHEIDGKEVLYVKGAYEALREKALNTPDLKEFDTAFHAFLKKGYRVIAFAESLKPSQDPSQWRLNIVGLIGCIDPPKNGVREAVAAAKRGGIHIIMITGDHPDTALAIAKEVGIWKPHDLILTGRELETLSDDQLLTRLQKTTVLARILPEHKYRVVTLLQSQKEIVAVTGDGVNDIPALKTAHIGIAMGSGAEASKSVARMILVDNNFTVIVQAIQNARVIAANVRKVIYYLVSTSIHELSLLFLSILCGMPICLSAIQILWINFVTDGVMDKTFPFAKEEGNVMKKPPQKVENAFFDHFQRRNMFSFGLIQGGFCFALYYLIFPRYSFETVSTILFTSVVMSQWANALQAQKEKEPFLCHIKRSFSINPVVFLALPIAFFLQCSVIYVFPSLFSSVPLSLEQWGYPLLCFSFAFVLVETRKWVDKLCHW